MTPLLTLKKWDGYAKPLPEYSEYYYGYDSYQCWAAACSNMLWMSGWADGLTNPRTGQPFKSEDDIFEYYNVSFSDQGGDADRGIDWFFMGEFCLQGSSNSPHTMHDPSGGLMPSFVSSVAQKQYDLVERPSDIERLLRVAAADPADRSVFEVTTGSLDAGELSTPLHVMTGIGLITDPEAGSIAEKYKAIILIDSDNDAVSSEEESDDWTVTRDSDGSTVASGSTSPEFNIYKRTETGAMLYLNKTGSGYEKWQPGAYTVTVSFNKDRKVKESYYRNTFDRTLHFTVTEKTAPEDTDDGSQDSDSPEKEGGKKAANNSVRTGDEANLALWMLTAVLAAAAFAIVITIKIRRSR